MLHPPLAFARRRIMRMVTGVASTATMCASMVAAEQPGADSKPEVLLQLLRARGAETLKTAKIEFLLREVIDGRLHTRLGSWQCGGPDVIFVDRGDEWGVVLRDADTGRPMKVDYNTPCQRLMTDNLVWQHNELAPTADVFQAGAMQITELYDPRMLGVSVDRTNESFEARAQKLGIGPVRWEALDEDGKPVVRATVQDNTATWRLDPELDNNPSRIELSSAGKVTHEYEIRYRRWDGVLFPQEVVVRYLEGGVPKPSWSLKVLYAEFNRAEHPARLGPPTIGIEPGTNITFRDRRPYQTMIWDGQQAISLEEFSVRRKNGEALIGPTFARENARLAVLNERRGDFEKYQAQMDKLGMWPQPAPRKLNEWEKYTHDFIAQHALDAGQQERALAILKDCTDEGQSYVARERSALDAFDDRLEDLTAQMVTDANQWRHLADERTRLVEPLERIFNDRLKPRIESLLTREQRAASQPAAKP